MMATTPSETMIRAWARLNRAQQLAVSSIEHALKIADLPPLAWYDVLLELNRVERQGLRPFELERHLLFAQHNLSRLLDRMERACYLERRPCDADGRGQVVVITNKGKALQRKMWIVYAGAINLALGDHLSERQAGQLDALLGKLIYNE